MSIVEINSTCVLPIYQPDNVSSSSISQTAAMRNASFGIVGGAFCRCKFCKPIDILARKHLVVAILSATRDKDVSTGLNVLVYC